MDGDGEIVTQLGLLLTQMGYARRALEDIERATARYAGIAVNLTGGGRPFGAPPMLDGALKVYVINLGDLLADRSGPGLLEGLLGGAGRFLGGFIGGAAGGVLGGIALPYNLAQVAAITKSVAEILARLGSDPDKGQGGFWTHLSELNAFVDKVRALFTTLTPKPAQSAKPAAAAAATGEGFGPPPQAWLDTFQKLREVIDGLTTLVPLLVGALADLLYRLGDIRAAVAGFLDFVLERTLLLRGVILVTVFDTVAAAADLGAQVLTVMAGAAGPMLTSVVKVVDALLDVGISGLALLGAGLKKIVDGLMVFLSQGIGNLLLFLGDTRVFRVIVHLVDVLPLVLPALLRLFDKQLTPEETTALTAAKNVATQGPKAGFTAPPGQIAAFPDLGAAALAGGPLRQFQDDLKSASTRAVTAVHDGITAAAQASYQIANTAAGAVKKADTQLDTDLGRVGSSAVELQKAFAAAEARTAPPAAKSGLAAVAEAYESWLAKDGMRTLLGALNRELAASAATPEGAGGLAGRIAAAGGEGRQATVEVGEVVVELVGTAAQQTEAPWNDIEDLSERLRAHDRSLEERRGTVPVP
jgi:hypothetical protein